MSEIGVDLYLTSKTTGFAPASDPNAVVLIDYFLSNGLDHIDFLRVASGNLIGMMEVAGTDAYSPQYTKTTYSIPPSEADRYEGILQYESWTLNPGQGYPPFGALRGLEFDEESGRRPDPRSMDLVYGSGHDSLFLTSAVDVV